jgi:hypothetical protein
MRAAEACARWWLLGRRTEFPISSFQIQAMTTTPPPPDMTKEHAAEIKSLRKEAGRLIKADTKREKELLAAVRRIEKRVLKEVNRIERKARLEIKALEKTAAKEARPLHQEWLKRTEGCVTNQRLQAVRHRIAVLEGRITS